MIEITILLITFCIVVAVCVLFLVTFFFCTKDSCCDRRRSDRQPTNNGAVNIPEVTPLPGNHGNMVFVGDIISGGPTEFHWKPPSYNQVATLPSYEQAINGDNETEVTVNSEPDVTTAQSVSEPDVTTAQSVSEQDVTTECSVSSPEVIRKDPESGVASEGAHSEQEVTKNGAHFRAEVGGGSLETPTGDRQQNSQRDQPSAESSAANQGVDNNAFVDDVIDNDGNPPIRNTSTTDRPTARHVTSGSHRNTSISE